MVSSMIVSRMRNWIKSADIRDAAEALREDGKRFFSAAEPAELVWQDLAAYFETGSLQNADMYRAGWRVTDYANNVARGTDNIAIRLEDCASKIEALEKSRDALIERAAEISQGLSDNATIPEATSPGSSASCKTTSPEEQAKRDEFRRYSDMSDEVHEEIFDLEKKYREVFEEIADDLKSLDDDGTTSNPWLGRIVGGAIIICAFIPPISGAAAVAGVVKTAYDEYNTRMRYLKEEHPELTDSQMNSDAQKAAAIRTIPQVILQVGSSTVTTYVVGNVVKQRVVVRATGEIVSEVTLGTVGDVAAGKTSSATGIGEYPAPNRSGVPEPVLGPVLPEPRPSTVRAGETEARRNDPTYVVMTKDYDGDGYTDPAFRPGSQQVEDDWVDPADVVLQPPPGGVDPAEVPAS